MRRVTQRTALLLLTVLSAAAPACSSCQSSSGGVVEAGAPALDESAVPAPAGLLAEVRLHAPDAFWSKIQNGVSGAVALLPPTAGEIVSVMAGVDRRVAPLVDGKATAFGAIADATGGGGIAWVVALPLTDATAAAAILVANDAGAPPAREVGGVRLVPSADRGTGMVVGLRGRWLVVAGGEDDAKLLAPYVTRTMPASPAPAESAAVVADAPASALAGPLGRRLAAAWGDERAWLTARDEEQRAKHGGRAPDFGDPRPIVEAMDGAVKKRVALLAAAQHARLTLDAGDDEVHAELLITPGTDAASAAYVAAMTPGSVAPIGQLPADAAVAILARGTGASRIEDSALLEGVLVRALGERAHEDDVRAIHAAMDDWAHAHGDWWTAALGLGAAPAAEGVWLRTPAEGDDASRALRELVELSRRGAAKELLAGGFHLAPASVVSSDLPGGGKATVATFAATSPKAGTPAGGPSVGLAWTVRDGLVQVAAGPSPLGLLAAGLAPDARVAGDPRAARSLAALHEDASFALF
ncbi:MAG TPA: hypothetical protein VIY73_00040, partial [Polyangiaceae bacterium]